MEKSRAIELLEHLAWDKDNEGNCYGEALNMAIEALKAQLSQEGTTKGTTSDTISRQWLLECVDEGWIKFDTEKDANRFIHLVRDIAPTAQPVATDINVGDTISRQAAIDGKIIIQRTNGVEIYYDEAVPVGYLKRLPSVQPERKKGEWIEISSINHTYKCSECGRLLVNVADGRNNVSKHYPYCHCGADMRGEKDARTD